MNQPTDELKAQSDKPLHTLQEWHKIVANKPSIFHKISRYILRDWNRDKKMCFPSCFQTHGAGIGLGIGQKYCQKQ